MTSEVQIAVVVGLVELILFVGGGVIAYRKFQTEKKILLAEANCDDANATKTYAEASEEWLSSYNGLYQLLQKRDEESLDLRRRIMILETEMTERNAQLKTEIQRRVEAERSRDELKLEVEGLRQQVKRLEIEIEKLKPTQSKRMLEG